MLENIQNLFNLLFVPAMLLIVAWILWRQSSQKQQNNTQIEQQAEQDKIHAGRNFELKVGKLYENRGYNVVYHGIEKGKQDGGIDLIAVNDDEIVLIQCKYWKNQKVDHKIVRIFFGDCFAYIWQNDLPHEQTRCVLAVPSKESLDFSAEIRFKQNSPKMRYEVIR